MESGIARWSEHHKSRDLCRKMEEKLFEAAMGNQEDAHLTFWFEIRGVRTAGLPERGVFWGEAGFP